MKKLSFRKLVTNLPFSPNLIHQVSFYARRLRREEFTRKIGLVITIFALVIQSFVLINPPQPTLAASGNDIIYGGVSNSSQIINAYDTNKANFKDILNSFGITKADLKNGHEANIKYYDYNKNLYSMGRYPYGFSSEYSVKINNGQTYYMRKLAEWGNASDKVWQFQSGGRTFMIMYHCGNLASIGPSHPVEKPAPTIKDAICTVVTNATGKKLSPKEQFQASFTVTNKSNVHWSVLTGQGKNPFILGTNNPRDTMQFGRNREPIPKSRDSGYGPLLEIGKTASWSSKFTAPANPGTYSFAWRVLQEGVEPQVGTACSTSISVVTATPPPVTPPPVTPPPKPEVCKYNPNLKPDDKKCVEPCAYDSSLLSTDEKCKVCEYDSYILASDERCTPCSPDNKDSATNCIVLSKGVSNKTQNIANADGTTAIAGDTLVYTIRAHNTGKADQNNFIMQDNIGDILEYAETVDMQGAQVDKETSIVSWPETTLKAGETLSRTFVVKVKDPIPQTPQSASNPGSYDLKMTNVHGDTINVMLTASIPKATEQIIQSLPETGTGTNIIIQCGIMMIVTFFYMRSRQLSKEISIVKSEFNYAGQ